MSNVVKTDIVDYVKRKGDYGVSKFRSIFVFIAAVFVLSGCLGGTSPEENIYTILESTVQKEAKLKEIQEPLQELEKKEQDYFNEMIGLGMKEFEQIVKVADQAIENVEKRRELINNEKQVMEESKTEFAKVDKYVSELKEDEQLGEPISELVTEMENRYAIHEKLTAKYIEALDSDRQLYELMKQEDLKMEDLEGQIDTINKVYQEIITLNEEYNTITGKYNDLKRNFYEIAELEVEEKE